MMSGVGFFFNYMTEYSTINSRFHAGCAKVKEMSSLNE